MLDGISLFHHRWPAFGAVLIGNPRSPHTRETPAQLMRGEGRTFIECINEKLPREFMEDGIAILPLDPKWNFLLLHKMDTCQSLV